MRRLFSYTAYGKITYAYGSAISIGDFAINCVSTPPQPSKKKESRSSLHHFYPSIRRTVIILLPLYPMVDTVIPWDSSIAWTSLLSPM